MESFKLADRSTPRDLRSRDGTKLFAREWETQGGAKGTILLLTGYGEQTGRYLHVGDFFQAAGFNVLAIDVRGQGRSGGTPAHVERYDQYLEDARAGIGLVKVLPFFFLRHSFSGHLVFFLPPSTH